MMAHGREIHRSGPETLELDRNGDVGSVGGSPFTALAPGSVISIFGSRLAESAMQAQALPLPPQLLA